MAVMARVLGIPARVAVGFLDAGAGRRRAPGSTAPATCTPGPSSTSTASGWVRFEPTPAGRASGVPSYTTERVATINEPTGPASPSASDLLPERNPAASEQQPDTASDQDANKDDAGFPWLPVGGGTAGVLLVVGALLLPRTVRRRRSRARIGAGPELAWAELRDTAIDLRVPWPENRSPRETRDRLVDHLGAPVDRETAERPRHGADVAPEAVTALDRIVLALEQLRYARAGQEQDALGTELETVVASLHGGATRTARRRAAWWPRSVLSRRRYARRPSAVAPITIRHGGVVDHVG